MRRETEGRVEKMGEENEIPKRETNWKTKTIERSKATGYERGSNKGRISID